MDWTTTPEGIRKYRAARERAHAQADSLGLDVGIERVDLTREFRTFLLPRPENRQGHELRCEVVRPGEPRAVHRV